MSFPSRLSTLRIASMLRLPNASSLLAKHSHVLRLSALSKQHRITEATELTHLASRLGITEPAVTEPKPDGKKRTLLCIDWGMRHLGLAVSTHNCRQSAVLPPLQRFTRHHASQEQLASISAHDSTSSSASPFQDHPVPITQVCDWLWTIIQQQDAVAVVCGLPIETSNRSVGEQESRLAAQARQFAQTLSDYIARESLRTAQLQQAAAASSSTSDPNSVQSLGNSVGVRIVPIVMFDESHTTMQARRHLARQYGSSVSPFQLCGADGGLRSTLAQLADADAKREKKQLDSLAAQFILQRYLDHLQYTITGNTEWQHMNPNQIDDMITDKRMHYDYSQSE